MIPRQEWKRRMLKPGVWVDEVVLTFVSNIVINSGSTCSTILITIVVAIDSIIVMVTIAIYIIIMIASVVSIIE